MTRQEEQLDLEAVVQFCREQLGLATADSESSFFAAGGDSLAAVELCSWLESMLNVEVAVTVVYDAESLTSLHRRAQALGTAQSP